MKIDFAVLSNPLYFGYYISLTDLVWTHIEADEVFFAELMRRLLSLLNYEYGTDPETFEETITQEVKLVIDDLPIDLEESIYREEITDELVGFLILVRSTLPPYQTIEYAGFAGMAENCYLRLLVDRT